MSVRENLLLPGQARWPAERPVIELTSVRKAFGADVVLDGLSLTVPTGQTTVIAGQSGSGKSVLLRLMNGLTLPDAGQVTVFGEDLGRLSERARTSLRKRMSMVFQNYALIDSMTVAENVAFPLVQNTSLSGKDIEARVRALLELLELPEAYGRMPAELSGGMKKRVALARAVVTNPEVVLFDEPTTGLDPVMIEFVDDLIIRTQREFAITSVIISHDMASNRRLADHLAILAGGRIVSEGPFEAVVADPQPAVRAFVGAAVTERMQRTVAAAPATPGDQPAPAAPAWRPAPDDRPPVALVRGLHKRFGETHVLKGIDLTIPERRITVVIGGSGSGKSVLIKHLIGLLDQSAGEVITLGQDWRQLNGRARQALQGRIGMLFQGAALFDSMTVRENIGFPLAEGQRLRAREVRARVEAIAERTKVHGLLDRFPAAISNGERKRVGLARALITQPEIMVYDEPTTGQDPVMMQRVDDMIVETSQVFEITSIVISHDMLSTFRVADKIALIHKGELVAAGTPDELKACPDPRVQGFIFAGAQRAAAP